MAGRYVLLRGLGRGNAHWADFKKVLGAKAPQFEIDLIEIPGNGSRFSEVSPLSGEEIITQFRRDLGTNFSKGSIHLIGISLGGMLALKWAELYPEDLASLTIINSSLKQYSGFFQRLLPQNYWRIFATALYLNPKKREKLILEMTVNNNDIIKQNIDLFTQIAIQSPVKKSNLLRQLLLANSIKITHPLTVPLKVVLSKNDRLVHSSCSIQIAAAFGAEMYVHPSAGHDLPLEAPHWLADVITSSTNMIPGNPAAVKASI